MKIIVRKNDVQVGHVEFMPVVAFGPNSGFAASGEIPEQVVREITSSYYHDNNSVGQCLIGLTEYKWAVAPD